MSTKTEHYALCFLEPYVHTKGAILERDKTTLMRLHSAQSTWEFSALPVSIRSIPLLGVNTFKRRDLGAAGRRTLRPIKPPPRSHNTKITFGTEELSYSSTSTNLPILALLLLSFQALGTSIFLIPLPIAHCLKISYVLWLIVQVILAKEKIVKVTKRRLTLLRDQLVILIKNTTDWN